MDYEHDARLHACHACPRRYQDPLQELAEMMPGKPIIAFTPPEESK